MKTFMNILAQLTLIGLIALLTFDTASNIASMRTEIFELAMRDNASDYISIIIPYSILSLCLLPFLGLLVGVLYYLVKYVHPLQAGNKVAIEEPTN